MPRSHVGVNLACNSSVISWSDLHALRLGKSLALQACADLAHMPLTRGVMMPATRGWNKWPSLKCDVKAICHRGNQRQEKYKQRNKKTNTHHARPHQEPGMAGQSFLLCNALVTEQSTCRDVVRARAPFFRGCCIRTSVDLTSTSSMIQMILSPCGSSVWPLNFLKGVGRPGISRRLIWKTANFEKLLGLHGKSKRAWVIRLCASVVGHRWQLNGA